MPPMSRLLWLGMAHVLALEHLAGGWFAARLGIGSVVEPASLSDAERQFSERMRNVRLVGTFSVTGREDRTPREDGYEIESVEKVGDDLWRFNAKIGLRGGTALIPVVVPMRWVGDTPMIMMTKTTVPGLSGSFTVRLFFHDDRYSGTWQHDGVGGGNMSGRIERQAGG